MTAIQYSWKQKRMEEAVASMEEWNTSAFAKA